MERITHYHNDIDNINRFHVEVETWIKKLMEIEFVGKNILISQVESAKYEVKHGEGFISIKYYVDNEKEKFPYQVRIPVEMEAFQSGENPIMFLLHVLDGVVDELEVYSVDGSPIGMEISVQIVKHKVADMLKAEEC